MKEGQTQAAPIRNSIGRTLGLIVFAGALNCVGAVITRLADNLLFLDMAGTALVSIVFGPIHGAVVGLVSNYVLDPRNNLLPYFGFPSENFRFYFLFSSVHAFAALVWSVAPRILHGNYFSDIFCDERKPVAQGISAGGRKSGLPELLYPSSKIFIFIISLSFASAIAASIVVTFIYAGYSDQLSCTTELAVSSGKKVCSLAIALQTYWNVNDSGISPTFFSMFLVNLSLSWPDHIACYSIAYLLTAYILDGRRYRMKGPLAGC